MPSQHALEEEEFKVYKIYFISKCQKPSGRILEWQLAQRVVENSDKIWGLWLSMQLCKNFTDLH